MNSPSNFSNLGDVLNALSQMGPLDRLSVICSVVIVLLSVDRLNLVNWKKHKASYYFTNISVLVGAVCVYYDPEYGFLLLKLGIVAHMLGSAGQWSVTAPKVLEREYSLRSLVANYYLYFQLFALASFLRLDLGNQLTPAEIEDDLTTQHK